MLKKSALRRITVSTLALIIVGVLYFFPNNDEKISFRQSVEYVSANETPIYLLNSDLYVIRTNIATQNSDTIQLVKELLEALTIDSNKKEYISEHFKQIIPKNTKVLDVSLENGLLKINFSKDILTISKDLEEKMN